MVCACLRLPRTVRPAGEFAVIYVPLLSPEKLRGLPILLSAWFGVVGLSGWVRVRVDLTVSLLLSRRLLALGLCLFTHPAA